MRDRRSASSAVEEAAAAMTAAIGVNKSIRDELRRLLVAVGRLPSNVRGRSDERYCAVRDAALRKLLGMLRPLLEIVLPEVVEDDSAYLADIRRLFLEPQETYSLGELAVLCRISDDDARAVFEDDLADAEPDTARIAWAVALRTVVAYNLFRPIEVERALGADFGRVRSGSWRTVPLVIHLPRFMVDALEFEGMTWFSKRTRSARIEKSLFDLFPHEHHRELVTALADAGKKPSR